MDLGKSGKWAHLMNSQGLIMTRSWVMKEDQGALGSCDWNKQGERNKATGLGVPVLAVGGGVEKGLGIFTGASGDWGSRSVLSMVVGVGTDGLMENLSALYSHQGGVEFV